VIVWDRGRSARNERKRENVLRYSNVQNLRAFGALRAGAPAVPANHLIGFDKV